ncbi:MAG: DNA internalization-related competence protein ComEC/Rec2 [Ignavibacteriales bacterium]|nr:DNA internalization-related competence protein ComEC/Rec2 [Ignavibacteriales bacterium]
MLSYRPVVKVLLPFAAGITLSSYLSVSFEILFLITGLLLLLLTLAYCFKYLNALRIILLMLLLVDFGIIKMKYDSEHLSKDDITNYLSIGKSVSVKGIIVELPKKSSQSVRFILRSDSILINGVLKNIEGDLYVSIGTANISDSIIQRLKYGVRLNLRGKLSEIRTARNPGEFDMRYYLSLLNIHSRLLPDKIDSSSFIGVDRNKYMTIFVYPAREKTTEIIDNLIGGEEGKFLKGLVVGERSEISTEVKTSFINSGVMHILAVSGLHVAIVVLILVAFLKSLRINEKFVIILTILLLIYYNFLTGSSPSVSRSVIMAIVFLTGKMLEYKTDMYNTIAVSALILLLIDAKQLYQPGFQLSYSAVISIVYLYPQIIKLKKLFPDKFITNRLVDLIFSAFAVSIAAGVGTLPFTSIYFGKFSVIGFVANIVVVPLSNIILALGMLSVAVSFISMSIASFYAETTILLTSIMLKLVEWFGSIGFASINIRLTIIEAILFYIAVGIVINVFRKERRVISVIAALILINFILYYYFIFSHSKQTVRLTMLDVGQGDAILIELPDQSNILIDAGPRTFQTDAGTRFVLPYLNYCNINHLDRLVITHPDADHLGGVPSVLRQIPVNEVWQTGFKGESKLSKEYLSVVDSLHIKKKIISSGELFDYNSVKIYILSPSETELKNMNVNNSSIVMKIQYGITELLLMGDAEREIDDKITKRYSGWLKSGLLKVSHHGSITGTTEQLIDAVSPTMAIISVGINNKFSHPSEEVLKRLEKKKIIIKRTDNENAVIVESDGEKIDVINWK